MRLTRKLEENRSYDTAENVDQECLQFGLERNVFDYAVSATASAKAKAKA